MPLGSWLVFRKKGRAALWFCVLPVLHRRPSKNTSNCFRDTWRFGPWQFPVGVARATCPSPKKPTGNSIRVLCQCQQTMAETRAAMHREMSWSIPQISSQAGDRGAACCRHPWAQGAADGGSFFPGLPCGGFPWTHHVCFFPTRQEGVVRFYVGIRVCDASTPRPHPVSRQSSSPVDPAEYPARATRQCIPPSIPPEQLASGSRRVSRQSYSPVHPAEYPARAARLWMN